MLMYSMGWLSGYTYTRTKYINIVKSQLEPIIYIQGQDTTYVYFIDLDNIFDTDEFERRLNLNEE